MSTWGVHGNWESGYGVELFLKKGKVGIGWPSVGDLTNVPPNLAAFRAKVELEYPPGPDWGNWIGRSAGILFRFIHKVSNGDNVILPSTDSDNCINIGVVIGPYEFDPNFDSAFTKSKISQYTHLRPVKWIQKIKRDSLSKESKDSISIMNCFCQLHDLSEELKAEIERQTISKS